MKLYSSVCVGLVLIMWCSDRDKPTVTRDFCQVYEDIRIRPSRKDTLETRRQIAVQAQLYNERCRARAKVK